MRPTQQDQNYPTATAAAEQGTNCTSYHLSVDIRGLLSKKDRELKGWMYDDAGKLLSPRQARESLLDELAKGRKVLPTGPCEGFSFETGCPGHKTKAGA